MTGLIEIAAAERIGAHLAPLVSGSVVRYDNPTAPVDVEWEAAQ